MKRTGILIIALLLGAGARAQESVEPEGAISYCLPSTSLHIEVQAVRETFHAGPYSEYASKYLGMDVRKKDAVSYTLTEVKMTPYMEADQSRRFLLHTGASALDASFLKLTSCGLVSVADASFGSETAWRFPVEARGDFAGMAVTSNLASEAALLQRTGSGRYDRVPVSQKMLVEKSLEKRASETAKLIFDLREKRLQIITGDTDATYSGEAMGAAVAELTRLEKEYMTMFTGYSEYHTQSLALDLIPENDRSSQMYVAFRISETAGLLPADNLSGKPVVLEINPEPIAEVEVPAETKAAKPVKNQVYVHYRIPAACSVRLSDGSETLLQDRVLIYQFGKDAVMPLAISVR